MRFIIIVLLFFTQYGYSQTLLEQKFDFSVHDKSIVETLHLLSSTTNIPIAFSSSFFKGSPSVSMEVYDTALSDILDEILEQTAIGYKLSNERIRLYLLTTYTISGFLEEAKTGERLIAASVYCPSLQKGTLTNEYGFFSLTLPKGEYDIVYKYLGYEQHQQQVQLHKNITQNIHLKKGHFLAEVLVTADIVEHPYNIFNEGNYTTSDQLIQTTPSFAGQKDPIRAIELLPGVQAGSEGLAGLQIRGGDNQHNLMLLDGVPIYTPYHLMGLFSVYNAQVVKSTQLLTGNFSAKHGGALSAIVDIRTRDGDLYKWKKTYGISFGGLQTSVEGPLKKDKGALLAACRISHFNFLFNPILNRISLLEKDDQVNSLYLDGNLKLNYKLGKKDRVYISSYYGLDLLITSKETIKDSTTYSKSSLINWQNSTSAIRWNHLFSRQLFANATFTYSANAFGNSILNDIYTTEDGVIEQDSFSFSHIHSGNKDKALKIDFDWVPNTKHNIKFGGGYAQRTFTPNVSYFDNGSEELDESEEYNTIDDFDDLLQKNKFNTEEAFLYFEDKFQTKYPLVTTIGMRASSFRSTDTTFANLEPRIRLDYKLSPLVNIRYSSSRMVQYLHLLSNSTLRYPSDLWIPAFSKLRPQTSWQHEISFDFNLGQSSHLSVTAYYKKMRQLYTLSDFATLQQIKDKDSFFKNLLRGNGQIKGLEILHTANSATNGYILSYTLAKSTRLYTRRNNNKSYPFAYDSRHQLKVFVYQKLGTHTQLSLLWNYRSPKPEIFLRASPHNDSVIDVDLDDGNKNALRSNHYHRLDIEFTFNFKRKKSTHQLNIGLYNAYNKKNIAFYHVKQGEDGDFFASPVYTNPITPSFSYLRKF